MPAERLLSANEHIVCKRSQSAARKRAHAGLDSIATDRDRSRPDSCAAGYSASVHRMPEARPHAGPSGPGQKIGSAVAWCREAWSEASELQQDLSWFSFPPVIRTGQNRSLQTSRGRRNRRRCKRASVDDYSGRLDPCRATARVSVARPRAFRGRAAFLHAASEELRQVNDVRRRLRRRSRFQ